MTLTLKTANNFFFSLTLWLMMLHHHTKFGYKMFCDSEDLQNVLWFRRYHLNRYSPTFWTFAVTLTLDTVTQFLQRTLRLMMLYYQTTFGCKQTSSLEDIVEAVIFLLYRSALWPSWWRQWKKNAAWHSGSWCYIISPSLVKKYSVVKKISSRHTFTKIWTFAVTLTLNEVTKFSHRTLWLMKLYYKTKCGCKQTSSLAGIVQIVIFWLY